MRWSRIYEQENNTTSNSETTKAGATSTFFHMQDKTTDFEGHSQCFEGMLYEKALTVQELQRVKFGWECPPRFFFLTWTCLFLILFQKTEVKRLSITMGPWPYARHSQPLLVNYKLQRLSPINAGKSHGITPPNGSTVPNGLQACWSHWLGKKLCPNGHGEKWTNIY